MSDIKSSYELEILKGKYRSLLDGCGSLQAALNAKAEAYAEECGKEVDSEFPFESYQILRDQHRRGMLLGDVDNKSALNDYLSFCKQLNLPCDNEFWEGQFDLKSDDDSKRVSIRLLLENWQKEIDQKRTEWELDVLNRYRLRMLAHMEELLKLFESLAFSLESLGLDPGHWLDLSSGDLAASDIEQFRRWAEYLRDDPVVEEICELLGRLATSEREQKLEKISVQQEFETWVPDISSKEEVVGIHLGKDIENVIPSELALMADSDTSMLFDLKYVENQLMTFEQIGLQLKSEEIDIEIESSADDEGRGPIVMCIDTSGSMHGQPETIAKAVALFLSTKARQENRDCYLINFSTGIATIDLTGSAGLGGLIDFLGKSFHGGTDVAPAIRHALEVMRRDDYEKADLLVISDFIMGSMPEDILKQIEQQRMNESRFYSLVVGSCFMSDRLKTLFDFEWVYNPRTSSISELVNFDKESGFVWLGK